MLLEIKFHSKELQKGTQVNIILPSIATDFQKTHKTLCFFHGLTGDHTTWLRQTMIERYAVENKLAVIMPNVDRSWYTDTAYDVNYFSFVSKELPDICHSFLKGLSEKRKDYIVAGLSMGGYGALKLALTTPKNTGIAFLSQVRLT